MGPHHRPKRHCRLDAVSEMNKIIETHVEPGETLSEIATRYGVSVDALQRWNRIENPDLVHIGQKIVVYNANMPEFSASESAVSWTTLVPDVVDGPLDVLSGGAIVLALLLYLLGRKLGTTTVDSPQPTPSGGTTRILRLPGCAPAEPSDDEPHRDDLRHHPAANGEDQELPEREDGAEPRASARRERREAVAPATRLPSSGRRDRRREVHRWFGHKRNGQEGRRTQGSHTRDLTAAPINDGERLVGRELMRHYRDWMLLNDVMLPSGQGTTQIDHILVSPSALFLIETKEINGWVFGKPGQKQWTQLFKAGRRSRNAGIKSNKFKFYNPLLQNEGHAKALLKLNIVDRWLLRPIVAFVGDAHLKTADAFLPFDEHERIANQNETWRMRGVICMGLADLHRYIAFSCNCSSYPDLTRQEMETICTKIRATEIPVTAESRAKHVDFVRSVREMKSR